MVISSRFTHVVVIVPTAWEALPLHDEIMMGLTPDPTFHNHPYPTYSQDFPNGRITLVESYIAPHNAAAAAGWTIATHKPTYLLMAGSAGGTTSNLLPGDIVLGTEYKQIFPSSVQANRKKLGLPSGGSRFLACGKPIHTDVVEADQFLFQQAIMACDEVIPKLPTWPHMARAPLLTTGCIGSMDDWSTDVADLERLRSEGVDIQDMESAFVAMVAASHRIPFLAVRGVSNNLLLGYQPQDFDEVKASSTLASTNAGEVIAALIVRLMTQ